MPDAIGASIPDVWLVRHGETAWSAAWRHTGRTDLELTPRGEEQARLLGRRLAKGAFTLVLTSPLRRARDTCRIAGWADGADADDDLCEWDYGGDEGRTTVEIREHRPGWDIWTDGPAGGETVDAVGARADRAITRALGSAGATVLFAHAHVLRVLAARWLGLAPAAGRLFRLETASVSVLGHERDRRVIALWNDVSHLA